MSPFTPPDPAATSYNPLEELACGYWYSEVFFTALNLDFFSKLGGGVDDLDAFSQQHGFDPDNIKRLCATLIQLGLLEHEGGYWFPTSISRTYLDSKSTDCMRDFFLYRQYMQGGWQNLTEKIGEPSKPAVTPESSYEERNHYYVKALDLLARQKSLEISTLLNNVVNWQGSILDIGGGAGALSREFLQARPDSNGIIFDLPEVLQAARMIYPAREHWQRMRTMEGDFINHDCRAMGEFGLIIMANFLHAYDSKTAKNLLNKAVNLLTEDGVLLIHDYFPDRKINSDAKGVLYDLHMLANTYNGKCHTSTEIQSWLADESFEQVAVLDLDSDSSVMIASKSLPVSTRSNWRQIAQDHGFRNGVILQPKDVITAPWVALKCQFGCDNFGGGLQCPPFTMTSDKTRKLLDSYSQCLLVESSPPGDDFHQHLLALERSAFLLGHHKAFVLGAGPCTLCPTCRTDEPCKQPQQARPAMEACGIDVYGTMEKAGLTLGVRTDKSQYVKYVGLLLIK